ncbi:MAG TPA: glycosyltransferase [Verrucomicrobiae bacterium]|nr:glycosyltransferase [Verrucomicrobiae bacterium]
MASPTATAPRVIVFGTYDVKASPRVQVLIDGLKAHHIEVIECNVPLGVNTAARVAMLKQPWRLPLLAWRLLYSWSKLIFKARHLPHADMVLVGHLGLFDIRLARILFRKVPIALDYMISGLGTAKDRGVKKGLKTKLIEWLDMSALKRSNIIIVDTEEHFEALPRQYKHRGLVVYVGAPLDWFTVQKSLSRRAVHTPIKAIFFGLFTPLQGTPTIAKALTLVTKPIEVTLVGGGQDEPEVRAILASAPRHVKVTWLPWVEREKLPAFVASHDICLGIFGTTEKAQKVVPNKIYQGAAMGTVMVTSDTPPQRRLLQKGSLLVPPGDAEALANALDSLADDPDMVSRLQQEAAALAHSSFTPEKIIIPLVSRIQRDK